MPRVKLSPDYWKAIARDYIRGMPQREIATVLGISQQAVSARLKTMNFTVEQFRRIAKASDMPDELILKIMKGG